MSGLRVESGQESKNEDYLSAVEALDQDNSKFDFRPHLQDPVHGDMLVDSGSMCTAFPPDPGDQEVPGASLKAVNNTRIKFFGFKDVEIKINRKTYKFRAVKAEVDSPVLGWDFMRCHRLDVVWNEYGDNVIVDKRSDVSTVLEFKPLPSSQSLRMKNLSVIESVARKRGLS